MKLTEEEHLAFITKSSLKDEDALDIGMISLHLAAMDRPNVDFKKYIHHLEILGLDLANDGHASESALERAEALQKVLYTRHGYEGDSKFYDDLQNANLMSVIDRRKGIPISLCILYIHAARYRGWEAEAVNFPGHTLVRVFGPNDQVIIDPFHKGMILNARDLRKLIQVVSDNKEDLKAEHYEALPNRSVLLRLLNNIKVRTIDAGDFKYASSILERQILIDCYNILYKFELGVLQAHVGDFQKSKDSLTDCLQMIELGKENDYIKKQIKLTLEGMRNSEGINVLELINTDKDNLKK
jgi:regulator of sirC expression with transglutaminase-like and TPR domain